MISIKFRFQLNLSYFRWIFGQFCFNLSTFLSKMWMNLFYFWLKMLIKRLKMSKFNKIIEIPQKSHFFFWLNLNIIEHSFNIFKYDRRRSNWFRIENPIKIRYGYKIFRNSNLIQFNRLSLVCRGPARYLTENLGVKCHRVHTILRCLLICSDEIFYFLH